MGKRMTTHFHSSEFDCRDGTAYPIEWRDNRLAPLCLALEKLRKKLDAPITISSGYRTLSYNSKIGGARRSQHKEGRAVDIQVGGVSAKKVHTVLLSLIRQGEILDGGVGLYGRGNFVHYDQRGKTARWRGGRLRN